MQNFPMSINVQAREEEKKREDMEIANLYNTLSLRRRKQNWCGAAKIAMRIKKASGEGRCFLPPIYANQ